MRHAHDCFFSFPCGKITHDIVGVSLETSREERFSRPDLEARCAFAKPAHAVCRAAINKLAFSEQSTVQYLLTVNHH